MKVLTYLTMPIGPESDNKLLQVTSNDFQSCTLLFRLAIALYAEDTIPTLSPFSHTCLFARIELS